MNYNYKKNGNVLLASTNIGKVVIKKNKNKDYIFNYLNNRNFNYYPEIRNGNFLGELVSVNKKEKTKSYELKLPTDELFAKVHGEIRLHYTVYEDKNIILLTNITPEGILEEGHRAELSTYKGVMISKSNPEKDMFKVNLLNMLQK